MSQHHVTGSFAAGFEPLGEEKYSDGSVRGHVRISKTFTGGLAGTSVAEMLSLAGADGPLAYVAVEHVVGALDGRSGTFMLQHSAGVHPSPWLTWKIVTGSGTGELTGISGQGEIVTTEDGGHTYTLDYELP